MVFPRVADLPEHGGVKQEASRSVGLGLGRFPQCHGPEAIDAPLWFVGDVFSVPSIEHRGNARSAFRQLLARMRIRRGE